MKNNFLVLIFTVFAALSSCKTSTKQKNAENDIHPPKKINHAKPIIIPDVDVDEILRKNPPQYGNPNNKFDSDSSDTEPKSLHNYNRNNLMHSKGMGF